MLGAPPVAQTSYPQDAKTREEEGKKTYDDHDFSWEEDWLARWRAIALFGGLLLLEGLVLWLTLPYLRGGGLFGLAILVAFCGVLATVWSASELAMAFFGAAATGLVVAVACPWTTVSAGSSVLSASGSFGVDAAAVLGLLVVGVALLGVGIVGSVKTSRAISKED